jgi:hypothetical protein
MRRAAVAVIEKHSARPMANPRLERWDKRRAYGGLYRYYTLTSVLHQATPAAGRSTAGV